MVWIPPVAAPGPPPTVYEQWDLVWLQHATKK
jgi:hypothetical protein